MLKVVVIREEPIMAEAIAIGPAEYANVVLYDNVVPVRKRPNRKRMVSCWWVAPSVVALMQQKDLPRKRYLAVLQFCSCVLFCVTERIHYHVGSMSLLDFLGF